MTFLKSALRSWWPVVALQALTLWAWTRDLKSLDFSYIGDEWAFYHAAESLALGTSSWPWLSLDGVYSEFPVLGSVYQSLFLRAFGINAWAWKLSSIAVIVPLGVFFWLFLQRLFSPALALAGLLLLDTSFYLFRFFQIGYINNPSLLFLVILLSIVVRLEWDDPRRLRVQLAVLGACSGLSWYFYLGKLFPLLIGVFLAWRLRRLPWRRLGASLGTFGAPVVVLVGASLWATPDHSLSRATSKTSLQREFTDNAQLARNVSHGWRNQWHTEKPSHYLPTNAYLDRLSALAATLGLAALSLQVLAPRRFASRRTSAPRTSAPRISDVDARLADVWVLWLGLTLAIGLSSPYSYPPTTRGIHYVPFYLCFALHAARLLLLWSARRPPRTRILTRGVLGCGLAGALWLNLYWMKQPVPRDDARLIYSEVLRHEGQKVLLSGGDCNFNWSNMVAWCRATNVDVELVLEDQVASCDGIDYIIGCYPLPCYAPVEISFGGAVVGGRPRHARAVRPAKADKRKYLPASPARAEP